MAGNVQEMTDAVQPAVVLVRPQMGENIGAAARAMWNFGLTRMRVVAPRDGWPNERAAALASGAGRVLDHAGLFADTAAAVADCTHVYATTARARDMTTPVLTPDAAMADARARTAAGQKVAILFGPERTGLENDDIALANAVIRVPVNPDFPSLNLAQCVLLTAYEWGQATGMAPVAADGMAGARPASQAEVAALAAHYESVLDDAGFFFPDHKAASMMLNLRNMWSRMPLTDTDIRMLHGMLRQLVRGWTT